MLQIESCFVYPVKGMTPIEAPSLVLKPGESVEGDRAFVFAFADAERRGAIEWVSKNESITLLSWPELAAIETQLRQRPAHAHPACRGRDTGLRPG